MSGAYIRLLFFPLLKLLFKVAEEYTPLVYVERKEDSTPVKITWLIPIRNGRNIGTQFLCHSGNK